ncbi:PP2C family protein-serine/threonine phosphatase [Marivita geojedonensis]|uniref:Chemotaxis protein CheY n=1 Tax=Marivita geojedonensis TaxID=1123756 RepID=A0A1X4NJN2_9RHOB|nr:SpoIIE family protein phosphatase [Marivita geojedonensis]OSQ49889.1 chemotaxis protein CheY [Marivita geojedonensis]PRY76115.1 sigma-B regulation protein RsbU (phosphoserine phosphatase) [Marivita geojedonensis]
MLQDARFAFPDVQQVQFRRVLVVDDSRAQRRILILMLRRWGFVVAEADSGEKGLEISASFQPDFIISDWMMPGMSGLDFCAAFRAAARQTYGYFILLTSKSDKAAVASGLESGADDFLTKPVNGDELRARINAGARILSMEQELRSKNAMIADTLSELQSIHASIDKDLQQARILQQSLMPVRSAIFGSSRVSLLLQSCGHVGGDLAGMFGVESGDFGLFSLDVSGHGITSAMMTARVAGYLSSEYPDENLALARKGSGYAFLPPSELAGRLNRRVVRQQGVTEYLTLVYLHVCEWTGIARFVQAGHPPPLLLRRNGEAHFLGAGGLPIGLIDEASYADHEIRLHPGDRVLLYTDGFTESVLADGTMLDEAGLLALIQTIPAGAKGPDFLDALYSGLKRKTRAGQEYDDDISAALLEYGIA